MAYGIAPVLLELRTASVLPPPSHTPVVQHTTLARYETLAPEMRQWRDAMKHKVLFRISFHSAWDALQSADAGCATVRGTSDSAKPAMAGAGAVLAVFFDSLHVT